MFTVFLSFITLASGITANKKILSWLPPALFVGIRMLIPGIVLLMYITFRSKRLDTRKIARDIFTILLCAAFTTFIPSNLKAYALKNLISSKQAFLGSLEPFFAAIYGHFIFREKITPQKIIGLFVGFMGILFLLVTTTPLEETQGSFWIFSYPELAMLGAVALGRLGWTLVQKLLKQERYTPTEFNAYLMTTSGILSLINAFLSEDITAITLPQPYLFTFLMTYTIIMGNLVGYNLYARALKHYSTTFIALAGFSVPIWVHFFGYLFLGEPLSGYFLLIIAITFSGLMIFYHDELKRR